MRVGLVFVAPAIAAIFAAAVAGCGKADSAAESGSHASADSGPADDGSAPADDASTSDGASPDASTPLIDSLPANRDRLLATYFAYLKPASVTGVCDFWKTLVPSAQATFLTLTARLQASKLGVDGSSMLGHVTKVYRIAGGEGATATDPGSCGGGEFNRLMVSMDMRLHDSLLAANANMGLPDGGKSDIDDVKVGANSSWRESRDIGGAHTPFDISDETNNGAPRGQVQYFKDPNSVAAKSALGRMDLMTLVDPYALEIDHDYDCVHASNPLCDYITYRAACAPGPSTKGTDLYTAKYGNIDPTWLPADCAGK